MHIRRLERLQLVKLTKKLGRVHAWPAGTKLTPADGKAHNSHRRIA